MSAEETADLGERVLRGERRALARALTVVERQGPEGRALMETVFPATGGAMVTGFTGPPGVGKSTLVAALTARRRARGRRVAIVAVDPSSPFTSGALLGDRIRLGDHTEDAGVFFRSLATRGALGGLAWAVPEAIAVFDAAGFDDVFVETTGVGQSEIEIVDYADVVTLVLGPGAGDETQMVKAGVMEVPDVIVVNRGDVEGARAFAASVRRVARSMAAARPVPAVLLTTASKGEGTAELSEAIDLRFGQLAGGEGLDARRRKGAHRMVVSLALGRIQGRLADRIEADAEVAGLIDDVLSRRLDPARAVDLLLERESLSGPADAL